MPSFLLENSKNKGRDGFSASPYFFVLALIFSATFGLLFTDIFRSYRSDISVLVIPKNESASFQAGQIMENLTDIMHRLSFYDRVLFDNREIKDPSAGLTKDERKERWNENLEVVRLPESTTLDISVFSQDREEADRLARQTALSLAGVASRFYNIRTELEFRIIEGPISSPVIRFWPWIIALSVLSGSALAYFLMLGFKFFPGTAKARPDKNIFRKDYFSSVLVKPTSSSAKDFASPAPMKKASAPANLPIAEDYPEAPAEIFASLDESVQDGKEEPTDEEYRERLNKLLRGEI